MDESAWVLGIDLGSSTVNAAIARPRTDPRPLLLTGGQLSRSTRVAVADDGELVTGEAALEMVVRSPERVEPMPRRRLLEATVRLGDDDVPTTDLLAAVLSPVVDEACAAMGGTLPERLVLTHPASWAGARRETLGTVIRCAGGGAVPELLAEPVAAALHHSTRNGPGQAEGPVAIVDMGVGCDLAVLSPADDPQTRFNILAAECHDLLGGDRMDAAMWCWVLDELRASGAGRLVELLDAAPTDPGARAWRQQLRGRIRAAKHQLAESATASVLVEAGDDRAVVLVTLEEFDELVRDQITEVVRALSQVLEGVGVEPEALAAIYLSGGASKVRLLHRELTDRFRRAPEPFDDLRTVNALGAARFGLASTGHPRASEARGPAEDAPGWPQLATDLVAYLRANGANALDHASMVRAWLIDLHPNRPLETNLLLMALREGVVAELRNGAATEDRLTTLAGQLAQENAVSVAYARAAVATWMDALTRAPS